MNINDRIAELEEMKNEYILNESIFADDHPSWGELAEAQGKAESQWDKTDDGKELITLLTAIEKEIRDEYTRLNQTLAYHDKFLGDIASISQYGYPLKWGFKTIEEAEKYSIEYYCNHMELIRQ